MIRLATFILLAALAALPAMATTLTVKSGEHDGFSRLVLPLPAGATWALTPQSKRAVLRITGATVAFDITGVFDRIPRARLKRLDADNAAGTLTLELGCDCPVGGFQEGGRYLVVDISDPAIPALAPSLPAQPRYRFAGLPGVSTGSDKIAIGAPILDGPIPPPPDPVAPTTGVTGLPELPAAGIPERRLIDQILRASGQGLLDLRQTPDTPSETTAGLKTTPPNMAISSAMELEPIPSAPTGADKPGACPDDGPKIHEWGDDSPAPALLARHRTTLFTEFDRPDPDRVRALAQSYLYLGFGAEARPVLALADLPDMATLQALSRLVDGDPVGQTNPFHGQQHCDGDVALWAALADPIDPARINRAAVLRGFARLPAHLRSHLGPTLADRFTDTGDRQTAEALLRAATRPGGPPNPAALIAEARTDTLRDDRTAARAKLESVAASGSDHAPQALIALVDEKWLARDAIDPNLPDLIAAYTLEQRQSDQGPALRHTLALALALAGRFDAAMAAVQDVSSRDGRAAALASMTPVLILLTAGADDISFLRHALAAIDAGMIPAGAGIVDPLARRLLDLGLADAAGRILGAASDDDTSQARRLLRAEVALGQGLPHRAMVELLGLDGPEPARIRARAMALTGDFAAFADYMQRAGDAEAAARGFWLAGTPGGTLDGDGRYDRIAGLSDRIAADNPEEAILPPLAQARALLDNSRSLRDDIGALLDSTTGAAPQTVPAGQ